MFMPADYMGSEEDPAHMVRTFLTLIGRSRREIWTLFTRRSEPETASQRIFASMLKSCFETKVTAAGFAPMVQLRPEDESFLRDLGLTVHQTGEWQLIAYRGHMIALYEDYRATDIGGPDRDLRKFAELHGWPVLSVSIDRNGTRDLRMRNKSGSSYDDIRKRNDLVDGRPAGGSA